jgi:hypothetical protein
VDTCDFDPMISYKSWCFLSLPTAKIVPLLVGESLNNKHYTVTWPSFVHCILNGCSLRWKQTHWTKKATGGPKGLLGNAVNQRSCWGMAIGNPVNEKGSNAIIHNLLSKELPTEVVISPSPNRPVASFCCYCFASKRIFARST